MRKLILDPGDLQVDSFGVVPDLTAGDGTQAASGTLFSRFGGNTCDGGYTCEGYACAPMLSADGAETCLC